MKVMPVLFIIYYITPFVIPASALLVGVYLEK
jgi:hypothetical protein